MLTSKLKDELFKMQEEAVSPLRLLPLMDWTSSSTRLVKLAPVLSGTAGSYLPFAARSLQTSQSPAVPFGVAKSLQAALLTDAQLVYDGHSSLVLNGAGIQMKAGGGGLLCASQVHGQVIFSPFELEN